MGSPGHPAFLCLITVLLTLVFPAAGLAIVALLGCLLVRPLLLRMPRGPAAVALLAGAMLGPGRGLTRHAGPSAPSAPRRPPYGAFLPAPGIGLQGAAAARTARGRPRISPWATAGSVATTVWGPAWAANAEEGGLQLPDAGKVFNLITKGADKVYDASTAEGAKGLGLAFPVPKASELEPVTLQDFLPVVGVFILAVAWGLFVVPSVMDRSDGAKSVLYVDTSQEKDEAPPKQLVSAEAPIIEVKRLTQAQAARKKSVAPARKKAGFQKTRKS
mmetsp:Transcript_129067/g.287614  ORF Transcript_129067/g.287614 Transcript_129067/m.287614 type:complete len:274 (-) Transcript_129067:83-904(-)